MALFGLVEFNAMYNTCNKIYFMMALNARLEYSSCSHRSDFSTIVIF